MPENTPHPPQQPWEKDSRASRAPALRRLWPAGALALTVLAACVTALALNDRTPERKAAPASTGTPVDDGPGLLSFASPPARTATAPNNGTGMSSPAPDTDAASPAARAERALPAQSTSATRHGSSPKPVEKRRSVRSLNYPDRYWHISGDYVKLDAVASPGDRRAATFTLVAGLADDRCYSFATAGGGYLRHRDFLLRAEHDDGSRLFEQDATFCPRPSSFAGAIALESVNYPGRFLRHQNFQLQLDPYQNTDLYRADSAFLLVHGLG